MPEDGALGDLIEDLQLINERWESVIICPGTILWAVPGQRLIVLPSLKDVEVTLGAGISRHEIK